MTAPARPILANSCAKAATAAEAQFRIDRPIAGRSALVVALDEGAAGVVDRVAQQPWRGARFLHAADALPDLDEIDAVVMIATADAEAEAAGSLARAAGARGIMTAGLILGDTDEAAAALARLRPYARNLMVTRDEDDIREVLTALRA